MQKGLTWVKWGDQTLGGMGGLIGILILPPMAQQPRFYGYWRQNILTGTPGPRQIPPRDESPQMKGDIRFYDEDNFDRHDPPHKFRPPFSEILENTNELYKCPKSLVLDEPMVKFDGGSGYKVYMPQKPIKYGPKVYSVAPSDFPIVLNMAIHDGGERALVNLVSNRMPPFGGGGHVAHIAKFHMMPNVAKAPQRVGIGAVGGCIRSRLRLSDEINEGLDALSKGEFCCYGGGEMLLTCPQDSRLVCLLSNVGKVKSTRVTRGQKK